MVAPQLQQSAGPFIVEAGDGLRVESIRCRSLCRAIRAFQLVIDGGNVCEAYILDGDESELITWPQSHNPGE